MDLLRPKYINLNTIELSESDLVQNYQTLKSLASHIDIFPNLKSNAYGHGIDLVGGIVDKLKAKYIVVDSLYEAYELMKIDIQTPILISGYVIPENLEVKRLPFSYAVWSQSQIEDILKYQPQAKLHLFIDSGMAREGIQYQDLPKIEEVVLKYKDNFEGIMSHFASADEPEKAQTGNQMSEFQKAIIYLNKLGIDFKYTHISASAGLLTQDNTQFNAARPGIALYGIDPSAKKFPLKPVLSFKSKLVQIKSISRDTLVGYGGAFKADKELLIGIIPAGYNDGIDRRLSNKGKVKVDNVYCNIIGRVSMNVTTIDLSGVNNPQIGQEVEVYSKETEDPNSIENAAKVCDTIPYELLVHINSSIKRIVI